MVGGLPPHDAGPGGADRRQHRARRAVRADRPAARRRRAGCTSTRSRRRTPGCRSATTSATPRPRSRSGTIFELDAAGGRRGAEDDGRRAAAAARARAGRAAERRRACARRSPPPARTCWPAATASGRRWCSGAFRRAPQLREGESTTQAIVRLGLALDGEVLGDPGSARQRQDDGGGRADPRAARRGQEGRRHGDVPRGHRQPAEGGRPAGDAEVRRATALRFRRRDRGPTDNAGRDRRACCPVTSSLVGGTAWFWTRPDLAEAVDVLVVDEAGQFSLANAVAVARGARSMVLLGDPQQLAQPTPGGAPGGLRASRRWSTCSRGTPTMPADRGVFLDRSYRMHPELTAFVSDLAYEGRLEARRTAASGVAVLGDGQLSGSGLRAHRCGTSQRGCGPERAGGRRCRAAVALGPGLDVAQPPTGRRRRSAPIRRAGRRAVQRAGRADPDGAARRRAGRHGGQVPGPGGAGRHLLDDQHQRRRRTARGRRSSTTSTG